MNAAICQWIKFCITGAVVWCCAVSISTSICANCWIYIFERLRENCREEIRKAYE
jgi:hypothetical protein